MKKILRVLPIATPLLFLAFATGKTYALGYDSLNIPTSGSELAFPQNTQCRKIDFVNDENRIIVDNDKTTFSGTDSEGNPITDIYDLCVGSLPRFPSTSVEGGVAPYYYLKYRLLPDPMPVYHITTTPVVKNDTEIIGIKQDFDINMEYEAKDKASNEDIFLFYPYDKSHVTTRPTPKTYIRGPYQIGYNSYYHNTYRARLFASQVKFEFSVLEPKKGSEYVSDFENKTYDDKTILFSGEIIYDIPDSCYEEEFLDYKDSCREIEFYFPKGERSETVNPNGTRDNVTFTGNVNDTVDLDESSKNIIAKERVPYMNPGQHNLIINVTENTQLRVQKDVGTEYQTVGNEDNIGTGKEPWKNYVVYFGRQDRDIDGTTISPILTIDQITKHIGKPVRSSGLVITDKEEMNYFGNPFNDDWTYKPEKNEDWINYCDNAENDAEINCYHNQGKNTHFWQYYWSKTGWYASNPRPAF